MGKIIERCAGIDIGKRFLLCCVLKGAAHEDPRGQTFRFDVTVPALIRLRDWLIAEKATHVVMESTGSYWIPVFNILEDHFVVVLANPEEVKDRKGHKTDRKDAAHLAELLRHDHIRSSYIPPRPVRELRDITRRRLQLTQDATRERNRVQKLLEQVNVKIGNVLSDVFGVSGQSMLLALLNGEDDPAVARHSDGPLEILARGDDGTPWFTRQSAVSALTFTPWAAQSALPIAGNPALAVGGNSFLYAFARGTDGALWWAYGEPGERRMEQAGSRWAARSPATRSRSAIASG